MIVVLAHAHDLGAQQLVARWRDHDARLMTPHDVGGPGWRTHVASAGEDRAAIAGEVFLVSEIAAVVTRLPAVYGADLPHIVEPDREYVAAELTAFLIAWLDRLDCPVVNRPSAGSMLGPAFSPDRWMIAAARAGLALASPRYGVPGWVAPAPGGVATVVGDRWFGDVAAELGDQAIRLARRTEAELLAVQFDAPHGGGRFVGAELAIDITPAIADALLDRLGELARLARPAPRAEACA